MTRRNLFPLLIDHDKFNISLFHYPSPPRSPITYPLINRSHQEAYHRQSACTSRDVILVAEAPC